MLRNRDQAENPWSLQDGKLALLRTAADESARHVRGLYFKFLLFAFYVAVIVFSTDDEQLLKGTGAELPLLGVELPLVGFYVVIPWLVLIFHAHLLSQFYLLSRKLFDLDHVLGSLPSESARIQRGLIFPFIFSHRIVGSQHPRLIRWVFGVAVVVTILMTPILLLAAIQYKFLPYHGAWITFNHQLVLTLDLLLLWILWPRLSSRSGRWRDWWSQSRSRWGVWASTILLPGAWILVVPPDGCIERLIGHQKWLDGMIHRNLELRERVLMRKNPPVELLASARECFACGEDTKAEEAEAKVWLEDGEALDLRGRDLRYADFYKSTLWDADLRGANLQYAKLQGTRLQGADMRPIDRDSVKKHTDLRHAQLEDANLKDAKLREAQLEGADLRKAQLQIAVLFMAQLQIADLSHAYLQGAVLFMAQLQGANLRRAQLQIADLRYADLQGAVLRKAAVYGTEFQGAELSLADLRELRSLPVGSEGPSESLFSSGEPEWEPFSEIEALEARLEQASEHWPQWRREWVERVIERFWSVAFDLPVQPTTISPLQGFDVMHDWQGLFAEWPAPPDKAVFEREHADYRAGLACNNRYIAERMWEDPKKTRPYKGDPALEQALRAKAESGACSVLAEVLEKLSKTGSMMNDE